MPCTVLLLSMKKQVNHLFGHLCAKLWFTKCDYELSNSFAFPLTTTCNKCSCNELFCFNYTLRNSIRYGTVILLKLQFLFCFSLSINYLFICIFCLSCLEVFNIKLKQNDTIVFSGKFTHKGLKLKERENKNSAIVQVIYSFRQFPPNY